MNFRIVEVEGEKEEGALWWFALDHKEAAEDYAERLIREGSIDHLRGMNVVVADERGVRKSFKVNAIVSFTYHAEEVKA